ncbi:lipase 3 [Anoplophora glabripennis]|nr:lipase 3 [Anoplophora glabripennis]
MRTTIILCSVFALGACGFLGFKIRHDPSNDFMDMVKSYGYTVESHDVQTEDGYILTMFRIPHGRQDNKGKYSKSGNQYSSSSSPEEESKGVVFFMHGLMTNSESFIYGGPSESIALYLADKGYDVFFGNSRGTIYGQRHTTLDPKKDASFWRYCFDHIGTRDLPAMISKALSVSGQSKLSYIGHNEGTTSFYVLASEMPEMKSKIERHISLGPVVFLRHSSNDVLHNIEEHMKQRSWVIKNLGVNTFAPSSELTHDAESNCMEKWNNEKVCKNTFFLVNGYNSKHWNQTTMNQFMSRVPSVASVREILHLVQLKRTGRFEAYSEESEGKEYDLSKVTIPVALFYTPNDVLISTTDVDTLAKELPNVYWQVNMEELDNNLDLLYSKDMNQMKEKVEQALQKDIQFLNENNNLY